MKIRLRAIIALFTLLWFLLFTQASTNENNLLVNTPFTKNTPKQSKKCRCCCLWNKKQPCKPKFRNPVVTYQKLKIGDLNLPSIVLIFSEYLNVKDVLKFRMTCKNFQPLLQPNKTKITFYHYLTTERRAVEINVSWPVVTYTVFAFFLSMFLGSFLIYHDLFLSNFTIHGIQSPLIVDHEFS